MLYIKYVDFLKNLLKGEIYERKNLQINFFSICKRIDNVGYLNKT